MADVPATFRAIPAKVKKKQRLGARNDRMIPEPHYTSNMFKKPRIPDEHFQGIQRKGRYLFISGGLKYANPRQAQLIIIRMGSRPARGPWSIPEYPYHHKRPPRSDRIVWVENMDQDLWHAGGIQRDGDVLAVPLFGKEASSGEKASEVRFYDIRRPERPIEIPGSRVVRSTKAKAAGLTTLPGGHRLLVVWDDHHLNFYRSVSTDLSDGFEPHGQVHKSNVNGGVRPGGCPSIKQHLGTEWLSRALQKGDLCATFQNINLITGCNGKIYLLGFRNINKLFQGKGEDHAALYWVQLYRRPPVVTRVARKQKHMHCRGVCNFTAGAGIYREGSVFYIYGVAPYLHGDQSRVIVDPRWPRRRIHTRNTSRINFIEYAIR